MMNRMEELAVGGTQGISWVIDGIVLQHAGELLFDTSATSAARTLGRSIYSACLEDFTFAIVYGESFFTPGALIQVGGEIPGELLAERFNFMRRPPPVEGVSTSPDDLLRTPIYRERIIDDLLHLGKALTIGKEHWEHWIVREARVYLGNHSSLFDRDCKAEELQFGKFPPYACDKDIQANIPRKLVDHLVGCLSHVCQGYSRAVLEEFVQRCVLTLDVISWWYDAQSTKISSGIRLPFSVRSMIKQSAGSVGKVVPKRRYAKNILVRHAFADIILRNKCNTRDEVIDGLIVIRDQAPYTTIRKHWLDLEYELEGGNDTGIDQLIHDIRNCAVLGDLLPVDVQCDRETLDDQHRTTIRRALRNLVPYKEQEYQERMDRIFPELARDSHGKKMVVTMLDGSGLPDPTPELVKGHILQHPIGDLSVGDTRIPTSAQTTESLKSAQVLLNSIISNDKERLVVPHREAISSWFKAINCTNYILDFKVFWCIGWMDYEALRNGREAVGLETMATRLNSLAGKYEIPYLENMRSGEADGNTESKKERRRRQKRTNNLGNLSLGETSLSDCIGDLEDYFNGPPFDKVAWNESEALPKFRHKTPTKNVWPKWTGRAFKVWQFVDIVLDALGGRPPLTLEDRNVSQND